MAAYLKISVRTIRTYRVRNPERLPPSFKVNGQYRWSKDDVDRWVKSKEASNGR